jgi:hypothetical protein
MAATGYDYSYISFMRERFKTDINEGIYKGVAWNNLV